MLLFAAPALQAAPFSLPGAADAGRVDQRQQRETAPSTLSAPGKPMRILSSAEAPEQSKYVTMQLRELNIKGMQAFSSQEVEDIYAPYLHREITMDVIWLIAGQLTERYRSAGYFLSKVTVPQQDVTDGIVTLQVTEGYIGEIVLDDPLAQNRIVSSWLKKLKSYRPLKTEQIEAVLLQLNDLPGVSLHAVLEPLKDEKNPGAVRLILEPKRETWISGHVSADNNGSRFLGPNQLSGQVQAVLLPQQKTTLTLLSTMPADELAYGSIKHEIPVIPGGTLELYGTHTKAEPGFTLKPNEIRSESTLLGAGFDYQLIRQRQENLMGHLAFELRNTDSDILGTALTRDAVRVLRGGATYEVVDGWQGYNNIDATISQGIAAFGASKKGQLNLSRAQATPDFTKLEASFNRTQAYNTHWAIMTAMKLQVASGPLFSSEEFGYGGQAFGRAFDDSEITGDHGAAATAELRYTGLGAWKGLEAVPYGFYDVGIVWNEDDEDQDAQASGSSAGAGLRLLSDTGFSANFGLAFPLTRDIANPLYGNNKNPRYLMQISYGF